jgi:hypothetical protein
MYWDIKKRSQTHSRYSKNDSYYVCGMKRRINTWETEEDITHVFKWEGFKKKLYKVKPITCSPIFFFFW